jgi:hypothetical protein
MNALISGGVPTQYDRHITFNLQLQAAVQVRMHALVCHTPMRQPAAHACIGCQVAKGLRHAGIANNTYMGQVEKQLRVVY